MEDILTEIHKGGPPTGQKSNGVSAVGHGQVRDAIANLTASRDARRQSKTMKGAAWDRLQKKVNGELELDWGNLLSMVDPSRERGARAPAARDKSPAAHAAGHPPARDKSPVPARDKSPSAGAREKSPAARARTPPRSQTPPAPLRPPPRGGDRGAPRGPGPTPGVSSPSLKPRPVTRSRQTLTSLQHAVKDSLHADVPQPSGKDVRPAITRSPPAAVAQATAGPQKDESEKVELLERRLETNSPTGAPRAFSPDAVAAAPSETPPAAPPAADPGKQRGRKAYTAEQIEFLEKRLEELEKQMSDEIQTSSSTPPPFDGTGGDGTGGNQVMTPTISPDSKSDRNGSQPGTPNVVKNMGVSGVPVAGRSVGLAHERAPPRGLPGSRPPQQGEISQSQGATPVVTMLPLDQVELSNAACLTQANQPSAAGPPASSDSSGRKTIPPSLEETMWEAVEAQEWAKQVAQQRKISEQKGIGEAAKAALAAPMHAAAPTTEMSAGVVGSTIIAGSTAPAVMDTWVAAMYAAEKELEATDEGIATSHEAETGSGSTASAMADAALAANSSTEILWMQGEQEEPGGTRDTGSSVTHVDSEGAQSRLVADNSGSPPRVANLRQAHETPLWHPALVQPRVLGGSLRAPRVDNVAPGGDGECGGSVAWTWSRQNSGDALTAQGSSTKRSTGVLSEPSPVERWAEAALAEHGLSSQVQTPTGSMMPPDERVLTTYMNDLALCRHAEGQAPWFSVDNGVAGQFAAPPWSYETMTLSPTDKPSDRTLEVMTPLTATPVALRGQFVNRASSPGASRRSSKSIGTSHPDGQHLGMGCSGSFRMVEVSTPPAGKKAGNLAEFVSNVGNMGKATSSRLAPPSDRLVNKPVDEWEEADVVSWLSGIPSMPKDILEVVRTQALNGPVLLSLSEWDLQALDIEKFGHRRLLKLAADELRNYMELQRTSMQHAAMQCSSLSGSYSLPSLTAETIHRSYPILPHAMAASATAAQAVPSPPSPLTPPTTVIQMPVRMEATRPAAVPEDPQGVPQGMQQGASQVQLLPQSRAATPLAQHAAVVRSRTPTAGLQRAAVRQISPPRARALSPASSAPTLHGSSAALLTTGPTAVATALLRASGVGAPGSPPGSLPGSVPGSVPSSVGAPPGSPLQKQNFRVATVAPSLQISRGSVGPQRASVPGAARWFSVQAPAGPPAQAATMSRSRATSPPPGVAAQPGSASPNVGRSHSQGRQIRVSSPTLVRRSLVASVATATGNGAASPGVPCRPLDITRQQNRSGTETPPRIRLPPQTEVDDDA